MGFSPPGAVRTRPTTTEQNTIRTPTTGSVVPLVLRPGEADVPALEWYAAGGPRLAYVDGQGNLTFTVASGAGVQFGSSVTEEAQSILTGDDNMYLTSTGELFVAASGSDFTPISESANVAFTHQHRIRSSVSRRECFDVTVDWADSTDADRKGRAVFAPRDAAAARPALTLQTDGSAPLVGFLGATPVGKRTLGAAATDAGETQTLANALRQALIDLGLGQT